jgi:DNA mismatch endonuclease (patch repair protein)
MDIFTRSKRISIMRSVRTSGTKPELQVQKILNSLKISFTIDNNTLPGKPDIVLSKYHLAIFIHGCFWHGHNDCVRSKLPTTNSKFWHNKISGNIARDKRVRSRLNRMGWHVMTIWSCKVRNQQENDLAKRILRRLSQAC